MYYRNFRGTGPRNIHAVVQERMGIEDYVILDSQEGVAVRRHANNLFWGKRGDTVADSCGLGTQEKSGLSENVTNVLPKSTTVDIQPTTVHVDIPWPVVEPEPQLCRAERSINGQAPVKLNI